MSDPNVTANAREFLSLLATPFLATVCADYNPPFFCGFRYPDFIPNPFAVVMEVQLMLDSSGASWDGEFQKLR